MFKTLKKAFTTMPVVTHWIPGSPLIIEMNALDYTLATILSTISPTNNEIHPIAFHSCTLTSTKPNYDIHDNELLAIFEALKIWQHYLKGSLTLIDIVMDHKNPVHSCDIFLNTTTTYCRRLTIYHVKSSGNGSLMRPDGHLLLFSESNNRRLCRTLFPGSTRPRPKLGQHAPHNLIYWAHRRARRRCAANTHRALRLGHHDGGGLNAGCTHSANSPSHWFQKFYSQNAQRQVEMQANTVFTLPTSLGGQD